MPAPHSVAVLDQELAMARVGGDAELLRELAQLFLEEYPRLLDELRDAVRAGDARGVERSAHGLKGSIANFGAQFAVSAAMRLEELGRSGNLADAAHEVHALELALLGLRTELSTL